VQPGAVVSSEVFHEGRAAPTRVSQVRVSINPPLCEGKSDSACALSQDYPGPRPIARYPAPRGEEYTICAAVVRAELRLPEIVP
jgi:hypothetical protein